MKYFRREYIIKNFNNYTFFSYLLFINNFKIYRNIYRILKGFYFILAYLSYEEWRKIINIFILILSFHGVDIKAVIEAFNKSIKEINRDLKITVNKEIEKLYAFNIIFFSDIL